MVGMLGVVLADLVDQLRECQAVGRDAEPDGRGLLGELAEGLQGALRIGQRIAFGR